MTLDDLRVFAFVCDAGSLSRVARDQGTSQSAVSQHVRKLERELGVVLFERSRRGVAPTEAGRALLAAARSALASIDGARRYIERLAAGDTGSLRVSTGGTTLRHFMTRPLAEFRRRHPGVAFEYVSATSTTQCLEAIRQDRADLAYVTISDDHSVEQRPAARTDWVLVVRSDDPLATESSVPVAALADIRTLAMPASATSRSQFEQQAAARGVRLRYAATVDEWDTAIQLVELGIGHAVVPAMWVHDLDKRRRLRAIPIRGITPVTFGWAVRAWDSLPAFAHTFTELVDQGVLGLGATARVHPT